MPRNAFSCVLEGKWSYRIHLRTTLYHSCDLSLPKVIQGFFRNSLLLHFAGEVTKPVPSQRVAPPLPLQVARHQRGPSVLAVAVQAERFPGGIRLRSGGHTFGSWFPPPPPMIGPFTARRRGDGWTENRNIRKLRRKESSRIGKNNGQDRLGGNCYWRRTQFKRTTLIAAK